MLQNLKIAFLKYIKSFAFFWEFLHIKVCWRLKNQNIQNLSLPIVIFSKIQSSFSFHLTCNSELCPKNKMQDFLYWNAKLEEWGTVPDQDLGLRLFQVFGILALTLAELGTAQPQLICYFKRRRINSVMRNAAQCSFTLPGVVPVDLA